ncbi:hypothetical protein BOTCAL_0056g00240 [Botryotinia calthae]|uniref:Uncharacterized protein n=1 Tax=Botryotinia calthae TaxID=38488 RepID=A0A4Y8DCS4_9HELO|nr:hypothetical protein BOTCAL_0056g00240 [Botryotinia calthae]
MAVAWKTPKLTLLKRFKPTSSSSSIFSFSSFKDNESTLDDEAQTLRKERTGHTSVTACIPGSIDWQSVDERGSKLSEDSDIGMEMEVADSEQISGVVESVEPRVRFPVMTQTIFNSAAITQLHDDLEQIKNEVNKLRAASVPSKDEITLPKRMSLSQLTEMFPAVGDQTDAKLNQKLSYARE